MSAERDDQTKPEPKAEPEIDLEFELVDEAFLLQAGDRMKLEKTILAIAFLLEACTEGGNEPLDATIASGFADILRSAAKDAARLRSELRRLGAD